MNSTKSKNLEWVYPITMPQSAKEKFISSLSKFNFNPYKLLSGTSKKQGDPNIYLEAAQLLEEAWPECKQAIDFILDDNNAVNIVVIQNAPIDTDLKNIPTPKDGLRPTSKSFITEYTIVALAGLMNGYLRAQTSKKFPFNLPIHQVAPQEGFELEEATNRGVGNFPYHNDRVFIEEELIDYHLLYGLRTGAHPTTTNFLRVCDLLKDIDPNLLKPLFEKNYKDPTSNVCVAALHGTSNNLEKITASIDLHEGWMEPLNAEAARALGLLKQQGIADKVTKNAFNVLLEEGTIVLSDHKKLLHGRGSFEAGELEGRRWLQRAHLCTFN